ncbi:hypothetical protein HZY88_01295 [Aerococcaceae bacterium DSM 111176]|nr:hypothetical protein [Aerococcaceae bacterium DSM 111176]
MTLIKKNSITLVLFVLFGIATVAGQTIALILGQANISVWIESNLQTLAITLNGICGIIAFIYLLISPSDKQGDEEEEIIEDFEGNNKD